MVLELGAHVPNGVGAGDRANTSAYVRLQERSEAGRIVVFSELFRKKERQWFLRSNILRQKGVSTLAALVVFFPEME